MGHHIRISSTQVGELVFYGSGHFPNHGRFPVNHLVMGKYDHKILAVGINHAECQLAMVMSPKIGIIADIGQEIIHKAHIPL